MSHLTFHPAVVSFWNRVEQSTIINLHKNLKGTKSRTNNAIMLHDYDLTRRTRFVQICLTHNHLISFNHSWPIFCYFEVGYNSEDIPMRSDFILLWVVNGIFSNLFSGLQQPEVMIGEENQLKRYAGTLSPLGFNFSFIILQMEINLSS